MRLLQNALLLAFFSIQSLCAQTFRLINFMPTKIGEEANFQIIYKGPATNLALKHQLPLGIAVNFTKLPPISNSLVATVKFTPTQRASPGYYQFSFSAQDAAGSIIAHLDTSFQVLQGNHRPVLQGGPLEFAVEPNKPSEKVFTLKDVDQDSLVCRVERLLKPGEQATQSPIAVTVNPINLAAGTFRLSVVTPPTIPIGGTYNYQLVVDKYRGGQKRVPPTTHPIVVEVSVTNMPPKFELPSDRTFTFVEGKKATLTLVAADPNQDISQYTIRLEPSSLLPSANLVSTTGIFEWEMPFATVPGNEFMSVFKARCTVRDARGLSDTLNVRIKVVNSLQTVDFNSYINVNNNVITGGKNALSELSKSLAHAESLRKRDKVFTFATLLTGVATGTLAGLEAANSNIADSHTRPYLVLGFGTATAVFEAIKLIWPYPEKETNAQKLKQEKLRDALDNFNQNYSAPTAEQLVSLPYQDGQKKLNQAITDARSPVAEK